MENSAKNFEPQKPSPSERIWVRPLAQLPSWVRNKFFIAFAAFTVWMLFFDERDVFTMRHHRQELRDLQQGKKYYTDQINKEKTELENLKNNPATLEKYAREKYYMKRDNEDLFLVTEAEKVGN
jgi:cell division protein DivIC